MKEKEDKKILINIFVLVIIVVYLGMAGFFIFWLFSEDTTLSIPLSELTMWSIISFLVKIVLSIWSLMIAIYAIWSFCLELE